MQAEKRGIAVAACVDPVPGRHSDGQGLEQSYRGFKSG